MFRCVPGSDMACKTCVHTLTCVHSCRTPHRETVSWGRPPVLKERRARCLQDSGKTRENQNARHLVVISASPTGQGFLGLKFNSRLIFQQTYPPKHSDLSHTPFRRYRGGGGGQTVHGFQSLGSLLCYLRALLPTHGQPTAANTPVTPNLSPRAAGPPPGSRQAPPTGNHCSVTRVRKDASRHPEPLDRTPGGRNVPQVVVLPKTIQRESGRARSRLWGAHQTLQVR